MAQIQREIADGTYDLVPGKCPPGCIAFTAERLAQEIENMTTENEVADLCKAFIAAKIARDESKAAYEKLKARVEAVFIATGCGGQYYDEHLVHLNHSSIPASIGGPEGKNALIEALESDDDTSWITCKSYSDKHLREWVRKLPKDPATLKPIFPEYVDGLIEIVEVHSARARKSPKKGSA